MSKVSVTLNGRAFTIGCEEGQEAYLRELAGYLDGKVRAMSDQVGQIGDLRLLLMASLIVVDELKESEKRAELLETQINKLGEDTRGAASHFDEEKSALADRLILAAERLEALADIVDGAEAESIPTLPDAEITVARA